MTAVATGLAAVAALSVPAAARTAAVPAAAVPAAQRIAAAGQAVRTADVAGTAWYLDRAGGRVVVTADSTVSDREIARIREAAGPGADALRIERAPGTLTPFASGGDPVYAPGGRCSAGFNVRRGGTYYVLTAGHCTRGTRSWYADSARTRRIGSTAGSSFPGDDYGLVRYAPGTRARPGTVGTVDITGAARATVGMPVARRGATTGVHRGRVLGVGTTVNYGNGDVVSGLIRTDVCAERGDSGGPLHSGGRAVGLTSGGSGDCAVGGITYYQPVTEALRAYGVSLY